MLTLQLEPLVIIIIGFILTATAPISYALAKYFLIGLWFGRIGHLVGYGFVWSGSSAFVGDIARKREEATLMGWINMAWGICGAIGPIIMGGLLSPLGYLGTAHNLFTIWSNGIITRHI